MKKRKRIVLFVSVLLTLTVWDLSETSVAEATTGQVSVTGRIGETVTQEEEADDDNKKTIVNRTRKITTNRFVKHKQFDHSWVCTPSTVCRRSNKKKETR